MKRRARLKVSWRLPCDPHIVVCCHRAASDGIDTELRKLVSRNAYRPVPAQRHLKPACVPSALIALAPVSVQQVRGNSGNLRANMYVYRVSSPDHADTSTESAGALGPVVLEEGGDVGKYNRANRSLHHYIENLPPFLLGMPLCAYVFPAATFVLTCLFAVGRVAHQLGYTRGYGGHGAGFGIALLCTCVQDGLLLTAALSAAGASI